MCRSSLSLRTKVWRERKHACLLREREREREKEKEKEKEKERERAREREKERGKQKAYLAFLQIRIGRPILKADLLTKVYYELQAQALLPKLPLAELA